MKSLLLEAYVKGQQELLYVVPFVAKVLESSLRSVVSRIGFGLTAATVHTVVVFFNNGADHLFYALQLTRKGYLMTAYSALNCVLTYMEPQFD